MSITKSPSAKAITILCVLLLAYTLTGYHASAAWIRGISSNFDLHNFTEKPVNDLELTLGGITVNDIVRLYAGDLARRWIPHVEEGNREITITWTAPEGAYLEPCQWLHLGLSLRPSAPEVLHSKATWTLDGEPVGTIAFVWQNWDDNPEGVVDIIIPPSAFHAVPGTGRPDPLIVERRVAFSEALIPLDNLTQDDPMVRKLVWSEVLHVDTLTPDSQPSEMLILWPSDGEGAVLVQYTVTLESTDKVEAVFTNQARVLLHAAR